MDEVEVTEVVRVRDEDAPPEAVDDEGIADRYTKYNSCNRETNGGSDSM